MDIFTSLLIIVFTSIVIFIVGKYFATASSHIGDYFHLSKSVKGATLDAIASSFTELMVAVFAVIAFGQFDVGIGTIAGSAFFNLLIIPGIAVLVAPVAFKVSKEVISRDAIFYNISVFALLAVLLTTQSWGLIVAGIFFILYIWYLRVVIRQTKEHRESTVSTRNESISIKKEIGIALASMVVIGFASFYLTESAIELAHILNIPAVVIAFTVIAAATSLPDAVISIVNARKGNIDDAASNVFGSNIFDILIGLGIPLVLAFFITGGPVDIIFTNIEIIVGLLGASIIVIYFMIEKHMITKRQAIIMILSYFVFLGYVIYLSF